MCRENVEQLQDEKSGVSVDKTGETPKSIQDDKSDGDAREDRSKSR